MERTLMEPLPDTPAEPLKLVADDYWHLPEDGKRYEILDGGLNVIVTPNRRHQQVSRRLHCRSTVANLPDDVKAGCFEQADDAVTEQ